MRLNRYINTNGEAQKIKVNVDYTLGGANYFTGGQTGRGIYAYITNVKIEKYTNADGTTWTTEGHILFGGGNYKMMLEPLARKNEKRIIAQWEQVNKDIDTRTGKTWEVIQKVADNNNLTIN